MNKSKILFLITMLLSTFLGNAQKNTAFSAWFLGASSPLYTGGYTKSNNRLNISFEGDLKGDILYNGNKYQIDSFNITNSIITDHSDNKIYDLYDKNLKEIIIANSENQHLKIFRIPYDDGYLHRVLLDTLGVIIYDDNLNFNISDINKRSLVIQYKDEFYNIPKNKKKQQKFINDIFKENEVRMFIDNWLLNNKI